MALYIVIQKSENVLNKKNIKLIKPEQSCASAYNNEILNFCNPELQLKDTESAIKSKVIELLSELKGF